MPMKQVLLSYESGYTFSVDAIKYFKYNYNTYFIYTLHEEDEKEYIKLYIVKIMEELGEKVSQTIRRNDEWDKMKYIVKKLINEIRSHDVKNFILMDPSLLDGLTIYDAREFKLSKDLVEVLSKDILQEQSGQTTQDDLYTDDNNILFETEILELDEEENVSNDTIEILDENLEEDIEVLEL